MYLRSTRSVPSSTSIPAARDGEDSICRSRLRRSKSRPRACDRKSTTSGTTERAEALFARSFSLAHDILRPLVGPEPEVDGLAQFALARPLREFDLGNQRGPDEGRVGL